MDIRTMSGTQGVPLIRGGEEEKRKSRERRCEESAAGVPAGALAKYNPRPPVFSTRREAPLPISRQPALFDDNLSQEAFYGS